MTDVTQLIPKTVIDSMTEKEVYDLNDALIINLRSQGALPGNLHFILSENKRLVNSRLSVIKLKKLEAHKKKEAERIWDYRENKYKALKQFLEKTYEKEEFDSLMSRFYNWCDEQEVKAN